MSSIEMPVEFKHMVRQVGGDIAEHVKSMDDLVAHALIGIDQHQAAAVRPYVKRLLAQELTSVEMAEFWSSTPSGIYFTNGDFVCEFLAALLERLEREPYLTGAR